MQRKWNLLQYGHATFKATLQTLGEGYGKAIWEGLMIWGVRLTTIFTLVFLDRSKL